MNAVFQVIEMVDAVWVCPMSVPQYAIPASVAFSNEHWHKTVLNIDAVLKQIRLFDKRICCKQSRVQKRAWIKIAKAFGVTTHSVTQKHGHAVPR